MRAAWLILAVVLTVPQTPAQPFPNHEEPPPGWVCQRPAAGVPADHACTCHAMAHEDQSCEDRTEANDCKVWCHKDHCRCPTTCTADPTPDNTIPEDH